MLIRKLLDYIIETLLYNLQGDIKYPGINGSSFRIKLNKSLKKGSVLTYDVFFGDQLIVEKSTGLIHKVKVVTMDSSVFYSKDMLKKGTEHIKIAHTLFNTSEFKSTEPQKEDKESKLYII